MFRRLKRRQFHEQLQLQFQNDAASLNLLIQFEHGRAHPGSGRLRTLGRPLPPDSGFLFAGGHGRSTFGRRNSSTTCITPHSVTPR